MDHQNWIAEAREHWKQWRPGEFEALEEEGKLTQALEDAAEATSREMAELRHSGFQEHEAWEMVRERYLFPPPAKEEKYEAASVAVAMSRELHRMKTELLSNDPET